MTALVSLLALGLTATSTGVEVRVAPDALRLGDLAVVRVRGLPSATKKAELHAFGYATALDEVASDSWRGFIAIPLDIEPGPAPVSVVAAGEVLAEGTLAVLGRAFESSELSVRRRFTKKKPPALRKRIRRERRQIARVWAKPPTAPVEVGEVVRPTAGEVTSPFGTQRVFNEKVDSVHYGLDLDGRTGAPVFAALPGRVVMASRRFYSGRTLILDHGQGLFTLYFHLSKQRVRRGARVRAGQRIGDVGRTGRVTGPHLHFAVAVRARHLEGAASGKTRSLYVDPERLLGWDLGSAGTAPPDPVHPVIEPR